MNKFTGKTPRRKDSPRDSVVTVDQVREFVMVQAENEALWAEAVHIETGYTQQHLRLLHQLIDGSISFKDAMQALEELGP